MKNEKVLILGAIMAVLMLVILPIVPEKEVTFRTLTTMASAATKVFKLKFAEMSPPSSTVAMGSQWWASEVEKRTGGRVKFETFWGGSLIGAYEQLDGVKTGIIQVTAYTSGYHPDLAPLPLMGLFPLMNRGPLEEATAASDEWYRTNPAIGAEFKKNNVKFMYIFNRPNQFIWSRVPIKTLDDLKGLRMRSFGPFLSLFKELGCGLVRLPSPEVYDALERGAVDCTTVYLSHGLGFRYQEVVKYVNITNLGHNVGAPFVMNLETWNSLPADIQKIINTINREMIEKGNQMSKEEDVKDMERLRDAKMIIDQFSPSDVKKLTEIARTKVWEPYAAKLDKKGIAGTEALKHYIQLIDKYSKIYGR